MRFLFLENICFFFKQLSPFDFAAILVHRKGRHDPLQPPVAASASATGFEDRAWSGVQILRGRMHMEAINIQQKLVTQVLCLKDY